VALNKRKVLDAAQKYLQKGNLDKALKEYQKVLDADPKDSNVRLKVGDVQLRKGNSEAAIEAYLEVANQFMKKGFDAKAVALFKQITKIDEKRYDIYEPLAELYQRLSLTSEAMQALQTAAEAHQREGRKKEGLALLRKMASLDPSNTTTRMKIAEMLWKADMHDDAFAEYDEVVAELGRQGDHENVVRVHEQVLRNRPERIENLIGLGLSYLELGKADKADVPLLKATEVAVDSIEAWEGMARVHEALGRTKDLQDAWKTVAAIHKDRGNDEKAKEILQLYVSPHGLTEEGEQEYDETAGNVTLGDLGSDPVEELDIGSDASAPPAPAVEAKPAAPAKPAAKAEPAPEPAATDDVPEVDLDDEIEIELDEEVGAAGGDAPGESSLLDASPAASESSADADPAQLLAEAGVYLRYSQHDKAVGCLERILESEPGHLEALEKLGEARQSMGDEAAAVALWKEAADYARQGGNQEAFDALCERIRAIDESEAEGLAADALAPSLEAEAPDSDLDLELEFDTPSGEPELTGEVSSLDLEIDLMDSSASEEVPDIDATLSPDAGPAQPEEAVASEPEAGDGEPAAGAAGPGEESSDLSARFDVPAGGVRIDGSESGEVPAEDLEEAEFYFRQGLLDEAEQILKRLLAVAPGHPQVLLRLGEIAKSRGQSPSAAVSGDVDFDRTEDETQPGVEPAPSVDAASDATEKDLGAEPSVGEPPAGPDDETVQVDADDLVDVEFDDDDDDDDGATLGGDTVPEPAAAEPAAAEPAAVASNDDSGEGFDLAAELEDEFDAPSEVDDADEGVGGTTQAGFQSIFQSFKAGVKETLGEGEYETHYDLGIAYREMGLLEDAIGEFAAAMPSPTRKLDCLAMMGLCALDVGRAADAQAHLEQALAMPDLDEGRMAGLRFDLGRAFAMQGDWSRTRELWEQVKAFDPEFQDVATKLEELGEDSSPSLGVLAPAGGPGEALESFDDLIAEAESDLDDDDDDPDDGPDGPGGDDSSGDMGSTKWGGRKISYG
jgi:tetratricopeptide (TPR) repeat protein